MCFSYRFMPAVRYAKELLDEKKLGKIVSVDVEYLQSGAFIEGRRLEWRFDKKKAGTGAIGDLGVHLIDMTRYLLGDITAVCALQEDGRQGKKAARQRGIRRGEDGRFLHLHR